MNHTIISSSKDPAFNLAAEEYLLRQKKEDYAFFYINRPSVIIGKHQNALAEINLPYLEEQNIPVFRRMSGGGTVYHDEGNLNFCFIKNGDNSDLVNFKKATEPIVSALQRRGLPARNGERNDLLLNYKKISGNACHVFKRRVMHHGTLLYQSDLNRLTGSLKSDPTRFEDKAVKSVRSEVVNINQVLQSKETTTEFLQNLVEDLLRNNTDWEKATFSKVDLDKIEELKKEKYDHSEWNYRYGPAYTFKKRLQSGRLVFGVKLRVEKGRITQLEIKGNYKPEEDLKALEIRLLGCYHDKNSLLKLLQETDNLLPLPAGEFIKAFI
jgi:lipoate-protein ligase A